MLTGFQRVRDGVRARLDAMTDAEVYALKIEMTDGERLTTAGRRRLGEAVRLACARFGDLRSALSQSPMLLPYTIAALRRIDSGTHRTDPHAQGELPEEVS